MCYIRLHKEAVVIYTFMMIILHLLVIIQKIKKKILPCPFVLDSV